MAATRGSGVFKSGKRSFEYGAKYIEPALPEQLVGMRAEQSGADASVLGTRRGEKRKRPVASRKDDRRAKRELKKSARREHALRRAAGPKAPVDAALAQRLPPRGRSRTATVDESSLDSSEPSRPAKRAKTLKAAGSTKHAASSRRFALDQVPDENRGFFKMLANDGLIRLDGYERAKTTDELELERLARKLKGRSRGGARARKAKERQAAGLKAAHPADDESADGSACELDEDNLWLETLANGGAARTRGGSSDESDGYGAADDEHDDGGSDQHGHGEGASDSGTHGDGDGSECDGSDQDLRAERKRAASGRASAGQDIYGRPTGKTASARQASDAADAIKANAVTAASVPPALLRELRGKLNRLSFDTVQTCAADLCALTEYPLQLVAVSLAEQMLKMLAGSGRGVERLVAAMAALVALMQFASGVEIGARVLERIAQKLQALRGVGNDDNDEEPREPSAAKDACTLITFVAYLYTFSAIDSMLIADLARDAAAKLGELDAELLLALLATCGCALRADDPGALKDIVLAVQTRARELEAAGTASGQTVGLSARQRHLVECIGELKNNKRRREDETALVEPLLGTLRASKAKSSELTAYTPLHLTLEQLTRARKVGLWWLDSALDAQAGGAGAADDALPEPAVMPMDGDVGAQVVTLARKLRMSTDVRKSVFFVVTTASDYVEAFERLTKLGLKSKQQRQIVIVVLECAVQEQAYNPYYQVLLAKLCAVDHAHRITLQFALWDRFRELGKLSARALLTLAQLMAALVGSASISLGVLKAVEWDSLGKAGVTFFRVFFQMLLLTHDESTVRAVFERIATSQDWVFLRESVLHFLATELTPAKPVLVPVAVAVEAERPAAVRTQRLKLVQMLAVVKDVFANDTTL